MEGGGNKEKEKEKGEGGGEGGGVRRSSSYDAEFFACLQMLLRRRNAERKQKVRREIKSCRESA